MRKTGSGALARIEPARRVSPFEEMERRFEEFFGRPFTPAWVPWGHGPKLEEGEIAPSIDIYEEGGDVVVKAELPGMRKEDIGIELTERSITLAGEKRKEEKVEKKGYYRVERSYGRFSRSFTLPSEVRADDAKAHFRDGILEVRVPRTEEATRKVRKVEIG